jgi:hypothetical protein
VYTTATAGPAAVASRSATGMASLKHLSAICPITSPAVPQFNQLCSHRRLAQVRSCSSGLARHSGPQAPMVVRSHACLSAAHGVHVSTSSGQPLHGVSGEPPALAGSAPGSMTTAQLQRQPSPPTEQPPTGVTIRVGYPTAISTSREAHWALLKVRLVSCNACERSDQ